VHPQGGAGIVRAGFLGGGITVEPTPHPPQSQLVLANQPVSLRPSHAGGLARPAAFDVPPSLTRESLPILSYLKIPSAHLLK
jgi:hypothetical protein